MDSLYTDAEELLYDFIFHEIAEEQDYKTIKEQVMELDCYDEIHSIADSLTPIYHGELLELACDNNELAITEPELGPAFGGEPTPINIIAANVYEFICNYMYKNEESIKKQVLKEYHQQMKGEK
tara:strand:+ start:335 stop:706 length:372 start_codon:yes stop_codon:yes gene_type:complete